MFTLKPASAVDRITNGIGVYFFLLIFEGGLRRWILPQLSDPLLLIRDPVAIYIYYHAYRSGALRFNIFTYFGILFTVIGIFTSLFVGHGNVVVAIFGARIMLVQFPLIFIISNFYNLTDVEKIGRWILWVTIIMTPIICLQFYSPQSAWINRGLGGSVEGAGFSGSGEYFRPPGTFSFISGLAAFYGFSAPFVFYFWLHTQKASKLLIVTASLALFVAIPFTISRTVLFQIIIAFLFYLMLAIQDFKNAGKVIATILLGVLLAPSIIEHPALQTSIGAFTDRFTLANESEGGAEASLINRTVGAMFGSLDGFQALPYWGMGLGMGTNAGAKLMTGSSKGFLIAEAEWGRVIGESGFLLGFGTLLVRLCLVLKIFKESRQQLLCKNPMPWLLCSFVIPQVLTGQWGQPGNLGFAVLSAGLCLAALQIPRSQGNTTPQHNKYQA